LPYVVSFSETVTARGLPLKNFGDSRRIESEVELNVVIAEIHVFPAFRIFVDVVIRTGNSLPYETPNVSKALANAFWWALSRTMRKPSVSRKVLFELIS
jgi:hypothetical protein